MRSKLVSCIAVLLIVGLAGVANADISVDWYSSGGFYNNPGTWMGGGWPSSSGLRQLLWSSVDPATLIPSLTGPNYLSSTGNEYLLATYAPGGGDDYGQWGSGTIPAGVYSNLNVGGNDITNGWLYARIFQDPTVGAGDWYYQSVALGQGLQEFDPFNINTIISYDMSVGGPFGLNQVVVPEPATWAFMGLGALVVALRRFKRA